jgi:hypothetical protein
MLRLKAVSNVADSRILVCAWRSEYADKDIPMRIEVNEKNVSIQPNLEGLEWILNKDRSALIEEIRDMVASWYR